MIILFLIFVLLFMLAFTAFAVLYAMSDWHSHRHINNKQNTQGNDESID